ncbi:MAG: DUF4149 domain-containing protein [Nitrospirae bacterium]|nr:DUF4149 domain-containing protein [Nitrospirota bacterium]
MRLLYLLFVWLHILASAVWIGGMVFLSIILVPVSRRPEYHGVASSLIHGTGVRFRTVGWICLGALLLTGMFNLHYRGIGWTVLGGGDAYGLVLAMKLLLVLVIFLISALHDFLIGPRAMRLWQADSSSPESRRLRRLASLMGRSNLVLALLAAAFGVLIVRGWI